MSAEKNKLTDWQEKARQADLAWIEENIHAFKALADAEFDEHGPGAILVNTNLGSEDKGHPYWYFPQAIIEMMGDEETIGKVREYDPKSELVIILQTPQNRQRVFSVSTRK